MSSPDHSNPDSHSRYTLYGWISLALLLLAIISGLTLYMKALPDNNVLKELAVEVATAWLVLASGAAIAGYHSLIGRSVLLIIVIFIVSFYAYMHFTRVSYL